MIVEIKPLKCINEYSFRINGHYLGKDSSRNVFICLAMEIFRYQLRSIANNEILNISWQKGLKEIKKGNAYGDYILSKQGLDLLCAIYDKLGSFQLSFFEDDHITPNISNSIAMHSLKEGMPVQINTTILID